MQPLSNSGGRIQTGPAILKTSSTPTSKFQANLECPLSPSAIPSKVSSTLKSARRCCTLLLPTKTTRHPFVAAVHVKVVRDLQKRGSVLGYLLSLGIHRNPLKPSLGVPAKLFHHSV